MPFPVILRPVCGEDPSIGMHSMKGRSAGHRHDHTYGGNVDSRLIEKIGGASEDPHIVLVEAKHDAEVDGDSVTMQVRNQPAIVAYAVVRLVGGLKTLLRNRLKAQEKRLAPAPGRQLHELFVACGIRGALACPP